MKNRSASDIHSDVKVGEVHNGPARGPEPTLKAAVQEPKQPPLSLKKTPR